MKDYGGTADTDWISVAVNQEYVNNNIDDTSDAAYIGSFLSGAAIAAGGNNITLTYDAGTSTGAVSCELNIVGVGKKTSQKADSGKFNDYNTVEIATYRQVAIS